MLIDSEMLIEILEAERIRAVEDPVSSLKEPATYKKVIGIIEDLTKGLSNELQGEAGELDKHRDA